MRPHAEAERNGGERSTALLLGERDRTSELFGFAVAAEEVFAAFAVEDGQLRGAGELAVDVVGGAEAVVESVVAERVNQVARQLGEAALGVGGVGVAAHDLVRDDR